MATTGALSNYQERKFLDQFVATAAGYFVHLTSGVPTETPNGADPDSSGIRIPGFVQPVNFAFGLAADGITEQSNTIVNNAQIEFGIVGDITSPGKEDVGFINVMGYYVYEVDSVTGNTPDYSKPCFYGTLATAQTVNKGIDLIIKKSQIQFTMD
jgi:hypothetical protein